MTQKHLGILREVGMKTFFQFGTTGLMNYCRQVKPDTLEELIAMTALFRPGPMEVNAHSDFADIKKR